jgi:excisionase family DNA binding protein
MRNTLPKVVCKGRGRPKYSGNKGVMPPEVLAGICKGTLDDGRMLMSVPRVAWSLDVSEPTVYRWIEQGSLPAVWLEERYGSKIRRTPRVPAESLLGWLRSQYPEMI